MKTFILILFSSVLLLSCKNDEKTNEEKQTTEEKGQEINATTPAIVEKTITLKDQKGEVVINGKTFIEYYPGGGKKIKFTGDQDENGERDGKWLYFSEEGLELSVTNFSHGKKHGFSLVKYPNGNIHYTGEYINDEQVGIWKTYSSEGVKTNEKDYGPAK
ncbi:MAG: hypothetical protein COA33_000395 [Fluviicola sp.]|nr:hypothetical protein [Fluviicola sp.]